MKDRAITGRTYSNAPERQTKEALSRRHGSAGSKVQLIEPISVGLFPIKFTVVVLRAECREQTLGFLATVYDGPRLCACLAHRALSKDEMLHLRLLLCCSRTRARGR